MRKGISVIVFMLSLGVPFCASAGISITEIMYDPEGSDSKQEWIELYNSGPDAVHIAEWKYADKSNHALNAPPKNGGVGTMLIAPGRYVILASDATTFVASHPGISIVIDTTMSLNNSGMTLGLREGVTPVAVATYEKSLGASGNGDSLQWSGGKWIHAKPTPGADNALAASAEVAPVAAAKKSSTEKPKPLAPVPLSKKIESASSSNDPLTVVNATATEFAQTAAVGSIAESFAISYWWFAAAALAIGSGAAASYISRSKKYEWDIEES